jgi:hypothetical protein
VARTAKKLDSNFRKSRAEKMGWTAHPKYVGRKNARDGAVGMELRIRLSNLTFSNKWFWMVPNSTQLGFSTDTTVMYRSR